MIITWLLLMIFTAAAYFYGKRDFASPVFLLCISFWAMFSLILCNYENWDIRTQGYHALTTLLLTVFIGAFFFGSLFVRKLTDLGDEDRQRRAGALIRERSEAPYPYGFFAILSIVLLALYILTSSGVPDLSSFPAFRNSLRAAYAAGKEYHFYTSQIFEMLTAAAYLALHRCMVDRFLRKRRIPLLSLVPILCFLVFVLISTDRNMLVRFFISGLVLFILSYRWDDLLHSGNRRLLRKLVLLILAAAVVFWGFGKLKNYTSDFGRAISIYAGSGIYAFNLWLPRFDRHFTNGVYTFSTIRETLSAFGIGTGSQAPDHLEFIIHLSPNGYVFATNVYSALRTYYQDFGVPGLVIIPFLSGGLFEALYQMGIRDKFGFWWLFYAAHVYPVIYYPIAEQFLLRFHLGLVYEIFWLAFFYLLVYSKRGLWQRKRVVLT